MPKPEPITVAKVVEQLGGNRPVAEMFGVTRAAVSNWRTANRFPRKLHLQIDRICRQKRIPYDPAQESAA